MWFDNYSKLVENKFGTISPKPISISPFVSLFPNNNTFINNKNYHFMTSLGKQVNQSRVFDFLRYVFPVVDAKEFQRFLLINKQLDDKQLYNLIQSNYLNSNISKAKILFNLVRYNTFILAKEIERQISELLESNILHNRKFDGQLTIGDCGRFTNLLKKKFKVSGSSFVVNDKERATDVLERKSLTPVGKFVPYDQLHDIPSNSVDLITCFIGLHHYTDTELNLYMKELKRILRPNGIFILREHDVDNEHMESMVHVAHNIFNALTGLTFEDNEKEFRHFRSMKEWNSICKSFGFYNLENYQLQHGDSTIDLMTAYVNEKDGDHASTNVTNPIDSSIGNLMNITDKDYKRDQNKTDFTIPEWFTVEIVQHMGRFLQHTPWYDYPYNHTISKFWKLFFNSCTRVMKRDGLKQVFAGYFFMNLTIGAISSILLAQMGILAMLPRFGSKFFNNTTANITTIQAIISAKEDIRSTLEKCDIHIINETMNDKREYLYHVKLPRFLPFTQSLQHLAKQTPYAQLEEIAGNQMVNVKITIRNPNIIKFSSLVKCQEIENYQVVPNNEHHNETVIIYSVSVKNLIQFLREAMNQTGLEQIQIHDF
ncbi:predicted protein [Naegleria gruberi]|uniref:Predicted protein n=1 Tax=Naegleria gruberi TaxID=5762 RepID=D2VU59_NAEGR|nr:uncharacterized protein NAEGRDRAFT_52271 [Naegleria gruberi]EFC39575.1 predicted protein [Naegleria gruberi]|eukprot:XP_002672319.1 predicted protein [Naegleria gruberi strain NEG-M]